MKTAVLRHGDRFAKCVSSHVSFRLCKQDPTTRPQGVVNLREEPSGIVNFMHNGEYQSKVDLAVKVRGAERARAA